jgi:hypothetical protein
MYRTLLICAVISAATVGCTTPRWPPTEGKEVGAQATTTASSTSQPRPATQTASAVTGQPCGLQTGSRITPRPGECSISPGRSYSQTDIDRTGKVDVADALQLLDPSITVHH